MKAKRTALLLIDIQRGFRNSSGGNRNNQMAEKNIEMLVGIFRNAKMPVIHIQHLSKDTKSPLRPSQLGVEFIEGLEPKTGERIFQKTVNSAFIGTGLESYLKDCRFCKTFIGNGSNQK